MGAALKAKVSVADDQQCDPDSLATIYDSMASKFVRHGLDLDACAAMAHYFDLSGSQTRLRGEEDGEPQPLLYRDFPTPLPHQAVRLCVVFFHRAARELSLLVRQAAEEIMSCLPYDIKRYLHDPSHYHITIFMTSQPHTLRPDPFKSPEDAALPENLSSEDFYRMAEPRREIVEKEIEVMRRAAAETENPIFYIHRIVLADSGTLLLLCIHEPPSITTKSQTVKHRHLVQLRQRFRTEFPGAPPRQSSIFHASLARVFAKKQLEPHMIAKVQETADAWSQRLSGMRFHVESLHYVCEHTFTAVDGPSTALPFHKGSGLEI